MAGCWVFRDLGFAPVCGSMLQPGSATAPVRSRDEASKLGIGAGDAPERNCSCVNVVSYFCVCWLAFCGVKTPGGNRLYIRRGVESRHWWDLVGMMTPGVYQGLLDRVRQ